MAENDIYNSKRRYEQLKSSLKELVKPPNERKNRSKRKSIYYIKNVANLAYFELLFEQCEAKDLSYIRRVRLAATLLVICHHTDKNLAELDRDGMNRLVAALHQIYKTYESKVTFIKHIKYLWKLFCPEKDSQGRIDESIVPYVVRHLSASVHKSRQKLRGDRLTVDEFVKLVNYFSGEPRMQAYLTLALESLGRPQELLYTKIKDVELYDNYAKIWISEHSKEGVGFLQCIDSYPYLAKWLDQHPYKHDKNAYLFINTGSKKGGRQLKPVNINIMIRTACKKLGIEKPVTCYSLKRNGVTMRRLRGESDVEIQHAARWTSTKQLKTYDMSQQEDALKIQLIKRGLIKPDKEHEHLAPQLRECIFCNTKAGFNEDICPNCKRPLDRERIKQLEQEKETTHIKEVQLLHTRLDQMEMIVKHLVQQQPQPVTIPVGSSSAMASASGLSIGTEFKPFETKKDKGAGTQLEI